jgi:hypothetical protein
MHTTARATQRRRSPLIRLLIVIIPYPKLVAVRLMITVSGTIICCKMIILIPCKLPKAPA